MEIRNIEICRKNLNLINFEKVMMLSLAEGGAMGEAGGLYFLDSDNVLYHYNYIYSKDKIMEEIKEKLPVLKNTSCFFDRISIDENSWLTIGMGMGNYLLIKNELYDKYVQLLKDALGEDILEDNLSKKGTIYQNWIKIAMELIEKNFYSIYDPNKTIYYKLGINKQDFNVLNSLGYDFDFENQQDVNKINLYLEKNTCYTLKGYKYKLLSTYSNLEKKNKFQLSRYELDNEELSDIDKFNRTTIHFSNSCVWKSVVDVSLDEKDYYLIRSCTDEQHGEVIIKYLNTDLKPYIYPGSTIISQVNCVAKEMRIFSNEEIDVRNENNFKIKFDYGEDIYLGDDTILMSAISSKEKPKQGYTNFVRGKICKIRNLTEKLIDRTATFMEITILTEFGKTPILINEKNITYKTSTDINIGDVVEAEVLITGDLMLYPQKTNIVYDKVTAYEIFKRAFEEGSYDLLENIIHKDCIYKSENNTVNNGKDVINLLEKIYSEDRYEGKKYSIQYGEITINPINNFELEDEVICWTQDKKTSQIDGLFNLKVDDEGLITAIYFTTDQNIKFRIYDGEKTNIEIDDERDKIFKEIILLSRNRKFPESDINAFYLLMQNIYLVPYKVLDFLKNNENLSTSDVLEFEIKLIKEYEEKHPIRELVEEASNTITTLEDKHKYDNYKLIIGKNEGDILNITSDDYTGSEFKSLFLSSNESLLLLFMDDLGWCKLDGLKNNNRFELMNIDNYGLEKENFDNTIAIKKTEEILAKYNTIRIWSYHNRVSSQLFIRYFIDKFYNIIKDKNIEIVFIDNVKRTLDKLLDGEFEKLLETTEKISKKDLEKYRNEWKKIETENSNLRVFDTNKNIISVDFDYLFNSIIEIVKEFPNGIKRSQLFYEFARREIYYGSSLDLENYIINLMIEKEILKTDDSKDTCFEGVFKDDLISLK